MISIEEAKKIYNDALDELCGKNAIDERFWTKEIYLFANEDGKPIEDIKWYIKLCTTICAISKYRDYTGAKYNLPEQTDDELDEWRCKIYEVLGEDETYSLYSDESFEELAEMYGLSKDEIWVGTRGKVNLARERKKDKMEKALKEFAEEFREWAIDFDKEYGETSDFAKGAASWDDEDVAFIAGKLTNEMIHYTKKEN